MFTTYYVVYRYTGYNALIYLSAILYILFLIEIGKNILLLLPPKKIIFSLSSFILSATFLVIVPALSVYFNFKEIISISLIVWGVDSAGYFIGKLKGKHQCKFTSNISPRKTQEGYIASIIFGILISLLLYFIFEYEIVFILKGFIVTLTAIIGDLFESSVKRYVNVKDSSNLIPGHGGVLDVFDALIISLPVWLILSII